MQDAEKLKEAGKQNLSVQMGKEVLRKEVAKSLENGNRVLKRINGLAGEGAAFG